ncbi:Kinesin-like protein [Vigna angularis]|uniref:Kinesin-like protein n=1 Tax=Phaseolus angularis TaxID=3914 RepID=A0A8T0K3M6_PHAAN|nr:Kinesin-like protein [Vigna angularis]
MGSVFDYTNPPSGEIYLRFQVSGSAGIYWVQSRNAISSETRQSQALEALGHDSPTPAGYGKSTGKDTKVYYRGRPPQGIRTDWYFTTLENGGSPVQNFSTAAEDARLASLISLDRILKQVKDITKLSTVNTIEKSKKRTVLGSLDKLTEQMSSLLEIDHPCAQRYIADARRVVESIPEEDDRSQNLSHSRMSSTDTGSGSGTDVAQWNVLQFNTGNTSSFLIKCGANSNSELIIKAEARVQEPKEGEIIACPSKDCRWNSSTIF